MQAWCPSRSCPPTTRQSGAFQETAGGSSPVQRWMQDDQISRILMILTCIKGNSSGWPMNRRKPGFVEKTVDSLILGEISFLLNHYKFGWLHKMISPVKVAIDHNLEAFLLPWSHHPIILLHRACSTLFWRNINNTEVSPPATLEGGGCRWNSHSKPAVG